MFLTQKFRLLAYTLVAALSISVLPMYANPHHRSGRVQEEDTSWRTALARKYAQCKEFAVRNKTAIKVIVALGIGCLLGVYLPKLFDDGRVEREIGASTCKVYEKEYKAGDTTEQQSIVTRDGQYKTQNVGGEDCKIYTHPDTKEEIYLKTYVNNVPRCFVNKDNVRIMPANEDWPNNNVSEDGLSEQAKKHNADLRNERRAFMEKVGRAFVDPDTLEQVRFRVDRPVVLQQLLVDRQSGGSCPYHALKNTILILNELVNRHGNLQSRLQDRDLVRNLIGSASDRPLTGAWRQFVLANPELATDTDEVSEEYKDEKTGETKKRQIRTGDWAGGRVIEALIARERGEHRLLATSAEVCTRGGESRISVLEDGAAIGSDIPGVDYVIPAIRAQMAAAQGEFIQGFVVNTDQQRLDRDGHPYAPSTHWVSAVLHRMPNNVIRFILADSMNGSLLNSVNIQRLMAAFCGQRI